MINKLLNKNVLVLLDQATFSGGSFLSMLLLARILSPLEFGVYASVLIVIYACISGLNALIIQPFQVSFAREENPTSYITFTFLAQFSLLFFLVFIFYSLIWLKVDFLVGVETIAVSISIYVLGFLIHDYLRKLFLAIDKVIYALIVDLFSVIFQISVLIAFWLEGTTTLIELMQVLQYVYFPAVIVGLFLIPKSKILKQDFRLYSFNHIHQGKWLFLTAFTQWWSGNLFVVSSGFLLGVESLGAFRLVQSLFGILNLILQTFENFVLPQTSLFYKDSKEKAEKYLRGITLKSGIIFGVVLFILFIFSKQVIVFAGGEKYVDYGYIVKGMVLLYVLIYLSSPVRIGIRILLLNKVFFTGYLLAFFFSIATFYFLLKEFEVLGALIGLIASQLITLVYWQKVLIKHNFNLWK